MAQNGNHGSVDGNDPHLQGSTDHTVWMTSDHYMICASVLQSTPQIIYTEHHRVILRLLTCALSEFVIHAVIKGEYLVKNTTDIRIDVIFYD